MNLTGKSFLGYKRSTQSDVGGFHVYSLVQGEVLATEFTQASREDLEDALSLAESAFQTFKEVPAEKRALFLDAIAEEIAALGDELLERCCLETGLPLARITGEGGRTCGQLKMFAQLLRDGWYVDARIDTAQPERQPLPKSDIRRMLLPIGSVAVFGASNFPLAFSTAGGDTASALAAGCPVVVKAHPAHAGTNEYVSYAVIQAAQKTGMPEGVFSSLILSDEDAVRLVSHPKIKAVGFTGSRKVGMLLWNAANSRPDPIPVFAEMSSVNPVVLLSGALNENGNQIAKDLAASVALGVGQFCTNPGLVLVIENEVSSAFIQEFANEIEAVKPAFMLSPNICTAFEEGVNSLLSSSATRIATSSEKAGVYQASASAFTIEGDAFLRDKLFEKEVFGPLTLIVKCADETQLLEILRRMEGQLTATIHATGNERSLVSEIISIVSGKAGRVIYGGYPTGVEVCHSMQHGGPFPSTSDGRATSVGTASIYRFLRPVAFQDVPDEFLPEALKRDNPLNLLRLVDGTWTQDKL